MIDRCIRLLEWIGKFEAKLIDRYIKSPELARSPGTIHISNLSRINDTCIVPGIEIRTAGMIDVSCFVLQPARIS